MSETASMVCTTCEKLIVDIVRNPLRGLLDRVQLTGSSRGTSESVRTNDEKLKRAKGQSAVEGSRTTAILARILPKSTVLFLQTTAKETNPTLKHIGSSPDRQSFKNVERFSSMNASKVAPLVSDHIAPLDAFHQACTILDQLIQL